MDKIDGAHEKGYVRFVVDNSDRKSVNVTREKLQSVAYEVVNLVMKKNADYGDAWQKLGIFSPLINIADKTCRVENLTSGRKALVIDEGVESTLRDIVGHALLALLYLREHSGE